MMGECRVSGEGIFIEYSYYLKAPFIYLDIILSILHYVSGTEGIHRETNHFFCFQKSRRRKKEYLVYPMRLRKHRDSKTRNKYVAYIADLNGSGEVPMGVFFCEQRTESFLSTKASKCLHPK
jgi:hypothetical protein